MTTDKVKAIKATDEDALCVDAFFRGRNGEYSPKDYNYIAVPEQYDNAKSVTIVRSKYSSDYVRLGFSDKEDILLNCFEGESDKDCISEAREYFISEEKDIDDLKNWEPED